MPIHGYPKIERLRRIPSGPLLIEEKLDGSQISFGIFDGVLKIRSKRREIDQDAPGMFATAVVQLRARRSVMVPGWTYRGEYIRQPKHNALTYDRAPNGNVVLFDIQNLGVYLNRPDLEFEARRLSLETVPVVLECETVSQEQLDDLLLTKPLLGGDLIEGVVLKSRPRVGDVYKYVSDKFKEIHGATRKPAAANLIGERYCCEARWQKALMRLTEDGQRLGTPKDIGTLVRFAQADLVQEEADIIRDELYLAHIEGIQKTAVKGLAEWYLKLLKEDLK